MAKKQENGTFTSRNNQRSIDSVKKYKKIEQHFPRSHLSKIKYPERCFSGLNSIYISLPEIIQNTDILTKLDCSDYIC